jgi:glycosyltransferase involved in cell wall biosynthesis
VLITSNLAYPHIGGIENSIRHLAEEAISLGDSVVVASSDAPFTGSAIAGSSYDLIEKRIYHSHFRLPQPFRMFLSLISAFLLYREIRRDLKPDFVIARYHFNVVALWLAGLRPTIYLVPGVIKYQNSKSNMTSTSSLGGILSFTINMFLQWLAFGVASRICVFSRNMGIQVASIRPGANVSYVTPGVDLRRFSMNIADLHEADQINLLCVGRLVAAKGFDNAIQCLSKLPREYVLTIVGDGEEKGGLTELVAKLGLTDRVTFISGVPNPEKYYKASHIFLMTSSYEPFGQTVLEASACGLPIVAYACCEEVNTATEDILGDHAIYASEHSPDGLAKAVQKAFSEYYSENKKSREALVRHMDSYSWKNLYLALKERATK